MATNHPKDLASLIVVRAQSYRLRWHHVAVVCAISSVTHIFVGVVVVTVVLLSSRFFLLDESHHIIRQKKITENDELSKVED